MTRPSTEYRAWLATITILCALGALSALVPVVEHLVGAALIAALVMVAAVAVLRRELRIRRRLAAIRPQPAPDSDSRRCTPPSSSPPTASAATRTGGAA